MNKNKISEKQAEYNGICPNCGGKLIYHSLYEPILICEKCHISIDSDGGIIK